MAGKSNRGLASADEQTREEVARKGGEAVSKDRGHMSRIGKKGGETRSEELGHKGYQDLGRKGGEATAETHGHEFYSQIGKKGGQARANDFDVRSGELGRKGGQAAHPHGRGLQNADEKTREEVARKGGKA